MKLKVTTLALLVALTSMLAVMPTSTAAAGNPLKGIPIKGAITGGGTFEGTLDVTSFAVRRGQVVAIGTLKGTLNKQQSNQAAVPQGNGVNQQVTMPVSTGQHSCKILTLNLGPLHLNLLGLVVDLSPVNLDITAEQGSGNLLGNLLCDVAHLLDGNGRALGRLVNLLNQILAALG